MRLWALNIIFYVVQLNKKLRLLKVSNRSNMCINGKYGFLNEKGQVVIPAQFDSSAYFTETGISNVKLNGHRYTINTSGSIIKDGYTL